MPERKWDPSSQPAQLIQKAARLLARHAEVSLRKVNLVASELPVLAALKKGEAHSPKELAQLPDVEPPSVAQTITRMERDGLVVRTSDPEDGRRLVVELTERGRAALPEGRKILHRENDKALKGLSPEEVSTLVTLLQRVLANLDG